MALSNNLKIKIMICPRCNTNLSVSVTQGVEIDYCPNCKGVWLDRGELEKIIERTNSYSSPNTGGYGHYSDDNHHENEYSKNHHGYGHGHHSKHKRSFFSELFDF